MSVSLVPNQLVHNVPRVDWGFYTSISVWITNVRSDFIKVIIFNLIIDTGNNECSECFERCRICSGPNNGECLSCVSPYLLSNGNTCDSVCDPGKYSDGLIC